jgi:hypothetical protein
MANQLIQQLRLQTTFFHLDRAIAVLEGREAEAFTLRERSQPHYEWDAGAEVGAAELPEGELRNLQQVVLAALRFYDPEEGHASAKELVSTIRLMKRLLLERET